LILRPQILLRWFLLALLFAISGCKCTPHQDPHSTKKTYHFRNEGKAKSLDPQKQFDGYSAAAIRLVYDSLYMYHYLKRPYELVPNLAAAMPSYSSDGLVMTIPLRSDVYFQDDVCFPGGKGRRLVAHDVINTIKRFADGRINTQGSVTLIEGLIEGFDEFVALANKASLEGKKIDYSKVDISGVREVNETTIEIRLTRSTPVVFYVLANAILAIVPLECADHYGEDFAFHPVGTGPFKMTYRNRKGDYLLKKNLNYHLTYPSDGNPGDESNGMLRDAGKKLPLVDEIVLPVIEESQPAMLKFMRGQLDWVRLDADSFRDLAEKNTQGDFVLKPPHDKNYSIFPAIDLSTYWLIFNMKDPVVGGRNVKLRRAIAHAFNRSGYVDDIFNGRGEVVDSVIPSSIVGNAKDVGATWYPYDLKIAKKLLAEAGYPGGKGLAPITLFYAASPSIQRQYEYLRRNLSEIGVELKLETMPYTAYVTRFAKGGFQFSLGGWNADYLDAENFLMLFTKNALSNELYYGGGWSHPEFEDLLKTIRITKDGPERLGMIRRMLDLIKEDTPVIPIFVYNRVGLQAPWLKNFRRDMGDDREAVYVDIDLEAKARGYEP
jgi:oligopeptide transport system substrate-binding protein